MEILVKQGLGAHVLILMLNMLQHEHNLVLLFSNYIHKLFNRLNFYLSKRNYYILNIYLLDFYIDFSFQINFLVFYLILIIFQ